MREEEVASVAAKPSLVGLGSPSPLSCVPPLVSGSPLCFFYNSPLSWPAWKEACATLQKLLSDPLLVKATRGEPPWNAFRPDGVIIFSDILTPLPAFGVEFDIEDVRGPVIQSPIRSEEGLKALHPIDLEKLSFVGDSLKILRKEVNLVALPLLYIMAIDERIIYTLFGIVFSRIWYFLAEIEGLEQKSDSEVEEGLLMLLDSDLPALKVDFLELQNLKWRASNCVGK
ncbi:Uroporphyrinogen decarboxylase 1 [Arachis hypogaea]|nr:Uroporphyrinogen decarboxylase 1 [Arachis hypogaea]